MPLRIAPFALHRCLICAVLSGALAACNVVEPTANGSASAQGDPGSGTGTGTGTTGQPPPGTPSISGTPASAVLVGAAYGFQPTASDPNGLPLTFSIQNVPGWSSFDTASGALTGAPAAQDAGTYSNIIISVSDGRLVGSLPAFAIQVVPAPGGSAHVSWTPPTRNTDGSNLSALVGFRIHYGPAADNLNETVQLANPALTSYLINDLAPGTWYFGVTAYSSAGNESALSNIASKTVAP